MAGKEKITPPAPGAGESENLVEHVITQSDLDNNPDLVEQGVQVGETVKIPAQEPKEDEPETNEGTGEQPEWVKTILDSNAAVIASNKSVVDAFSEFKSLAGRNVGDYKESDKPAKEIEVDITAEYVVAEGKSFRDSKDFSKAYQSGESVSGIDEVRLKNLLNQGLIELAPSE